MKDCFDVAGKVALITGASKGLGRSFARALGFKGARLMLVARGEGLLRETAEAIHAETGAQCHWKAGDMSREADIKEIVRECVDHFGRVDILINNAAAMRNNVSPEETSPEMFESVMHSNVVGPYALSRAVAEDMRLHGGGKIVNMSSMSALVVNKGFHGGSYEVSKAALTMLTKTLATEWAKDNIQVNAICPGYFGTEPNRAFFAELPSVYDSVVDSIPLGRLGDPEELEGALLLLCSKASDYMTGSTIVVDGGYTIW